MFDLAVALIILCQTMRLDRDTERKGKRQKHRCRERERERTRVKASMCVGREREREKSEIVNCTRETCVPVCEYYGIEVRRNCRRIGSSNRREILDKLPSGKYYFKINVTG